jgi:SAM-dependent methyltransferase
MINREDVRAAYRLILGRDPENEEIVMQHVQEARSLDDLRRVFFSSSEFQHIPWVRVPWLHSAERPLDWPPNLVEVDASNTKLSKMMRHIEANWHNLGISDPHWSVLVDEAFRAKNIPHTEARFYESGKPDVDRLQRTAERCGKSLSGLASCFELGCGVGRLTTWLAALFERVIAADISAPHLAVARQTLDRLEHRNVDLVHVDSFAVLEALPPYDVFFSFIVLQHNPPPLIAAMLNIILNTLRRGGIAYFQVPTYRLDYRFEVDEYLRTASPDMGMEIHAIPQHVLFDILRRNGCRLLECREDHWTGEYGTISNTIFAEKYMDTILMHHDLAVK